jgi:ankyrin repeat protein
MPILQRLLAAGADVDVRDVCRRAPMHYAAGCNSVEALAALVEAGADVNARDCNLESPLFFAVTSSLPCTRYLLSLPQVELSTANVFGATAEERALHAHKIEAADAVRTEVGVH